MKSRMGECNCGGRAAGNHTHAIFFESGMINILYECCTHSDGGKSLSSTFSFRYLLSKLACDVGNCEGLYKY